MVNPKWIVVLAPSRSGEKLAFSFTCCDASAVPECTTTSKKMIVEITPLLRDILDFELAIDGHLHFIMRSLD
jgi:hypothetical protein